MLRQSADTRTLIWAFVLFPAVAFAQYANPHLTGWLLPLSLYMGFCAGVLSHNQNHCPTFTRRGMNQFYAAWLSVFYGYPTFGWIPTHNLNHHKFVNKPGDDTITWRYTKRNTWLVAFTYFFVSSYWQSEPIKRYIRKAKESNHALFFRIVTQYAVVVSAHIAFLALAIGLHGLARGALVYFFAFVVPCGFALWSMMFINFIQHVDCDPWSTHNHSRNFVGRFSNWLVFNNGLHTVHHENAGTHWSKLPALHAEIAHQIDPELCQPSILWFCIRTYLLGIFDERFRTRQIGRAAYNIPPGAASVPVKTEMAPVEAGVNASMA